MFTCALIRKSHAKHGTATVATARRAAVGDWGAGAAEMGEKFENLCDRGSSRGLRGVSRRCQGNRRCWSLGRALSTVMNRLCRRALSCCTMLYAVYVWCCREFLRPLLCGLRVICVGVDWKPYPNTTRGWSSTNHGDNCDLLSVFIIYHRGWFPAVGWCPREGWYLRPNAIHILYATERKRTE